MKKYFEEKKRSIKFKLAGPGHKLSQEQSSSDQPSSSKVEDEAPKRVDTMECQKQREAMLAAALQRSQGNKGKNDTKFKIKKSLPKESEVENNKSGFEDTTCPIAENEQSTPPGVFFQCPALDDKLVLSRPEWDEKIRAHISDLKEADVVLGSILQIKSLNLEKQADECILLLMRYLRNIIENPENDKFKSIRMTNPKFADKVLSAEGALDFILAVGFEKYEDDANSEPYLKFRRDSTSELEILINSLLEISGFTLELYRDFQHFELKEIGNELTPLPDDFFEITVADLKKQQQQRTTQLERDSMLMTKKMRELEKAKYSRRKALFTRIRIRLPNDHVIQGTFSVKEIFQNLFQFIDEHIIIDSVYTLMSPPAHVHDENDYQKTFEELNLQPAVQLMLKTSCENIIFKTQDES